MKWMDRINFLRLPATVKNYKQHVAISFKAGSFEVKTAETPEEIYEAARLRYKVFYDKFWLKAIPFGLDITEEDAYADHLLVKFEGKVVGTYRLVSSNFAKVYFSEGEFHHGELRFIKSGKLELSRAAILPDFRTGPVLNRLWKGIVLYADAVKARYLFGCASAYYNSFREAAVAYDGLRRRGFVEENTEIRPRVFNAIDNFHKLNVESHTAVEVPALVESYLKLGAKVHGEPAYDPHFKCVDFFTVIDLEKMDQRVLSRFRRHSMTSVLRDADGF